MLNELNQSNVQSSKDENAYERWLSNFLAINAKSADTIDAHKRSISIIVTLKRNLSGFQQKVTHDHGKVFAKN